MDKLDTSILGKLTLNSRMPITKLASSLKTSREVITYRLNRLQSNGLIQKFITEIKISALGFNAAAIFVSIKKTNQEGFKQHLKNDEHVSWVAELSGVWDFGFSIVGHSNEEINNIFSDIYSKFNESILDYRFTFHKRTQYFYEKYFQQSLSKLGEEKVLFESEQVVDNTDKNILKTLATNSRTNISELAKKVSLTPTAVAKRIKILIKKGVIQKFSIFIDISKLGFYQYSVFVTNRDRIRNQEFVEYLTEHPAISFIAEYIGDPFVEFGIFVENPYSLRKILNEIEEHFPSNRVFEVSLFQKEFVSIGPPTSIFEKV